MIKCKYFTFVFFFVVCYSCNKKLTVIHIDADRMDSSVMDNKVRVRRMECYLMKGYRNDAASNAYVDNYVKINGTKNKNYFEYNMIFIKESKKSNLKTLQASLRKNGEPIDNENDWIFYYSWVDYGKFFEKEKSDSGKMPSSKNIKIENIPIKADSIKR